MSYDERNYIDRWYEYQEQKREAQEWEERELQRDREIDNLLSSMTTEEQTLVMDLNKKLSQATQNVCYGITRHKTKEEKEELQKIYEATLKEFNEATKQWPILRNGF